MSPLDAIRPHDPLLKPGDVDARGAYLDGNAPAVVVDREGTALCLVVQAQQARGAREEVPGVVESVEPHHVGVEQPSEDQVSVGKRLENLGGRERAVKEVPAPHGVVSLAQKGGQEHQVVVVHPHEIVVGAQVLDHLIREALVSCQVSLPVDLVVPSRGLRGHRQDVVHERPQEALAEALVVLVLELGSEEHRDARESVAKIFGDGVLLEELNLGSEPSDPEDLLRGGLLQDAHRCLGVDGVRVHLEVPAVPALLAALGVVPHLQREGIAHDDHPLGLVDAGAAGLFGFELGDAIQHRAPRTWIDQLLQVVHRRARRAPHGSDEACVEAVAVMTGTRAIKVNPAGAAVRAGASRVGRP